MIIHQKAMDLANYTATPQQEQNATPLKVKAPAPAPKPLPNYQYLPAAPTKSGMNALTVNFGGVTVKDKVDVDMMMNSVTWHAKSVGL
jgi:hypothetical protein